MDMTYDEMLREMEAYRAATAVAPKMYTLTAHERMLRRLCGGAEEEDVLLAALRKLFTAEEAEIWLLCPPFSKGAAPITYLELERKAPAHLRGQLERGLRKLTERKVLLCVKSGAEAGYFARCDSYSVRVLRAAVESGKKCAAGKIRFCAESCVRCCSCSQSCPKDAVQVCGNAVVIDEAACIGCGLCVRKCPQKALKM